MQTMAVWPPKAQLAARPTSGAAYIRSPLFEIASQSAPRQAKCSLMIQHQGQVATI